MSKIQLRSEILFRAPTRVGLLADVTERLEGKGVNVLGIRAYDEGDSGVFLIFADDSRLAAEALETLDGKTSSAQVIAAEVPNRPGEIARVARALANADINVLEIHATTTDAPTAEFVLDTDDNVRALDIIQKL